MRNTVREGFQVLLRFQLQTRQDFSLHRCTKDCILQPVKGGAAERALTDVHLRTRGADVMRARAGLHRRGHWIGADTTYVVVVDARVCVVEKDRDLWRHHCAGER